MTPAQQPAHQPTGGFDEPSVAQAVPQPPAPVTGPAALTIRDLRVFVGGPVRASSRARAEGDGPRPGEREVVRGIDLALHRGRIHGLAGESGSGKTMTALAVLGLLPAGARATGSIRLAPAPAAHPAPGPVATPAAPATDPVGATELVDGGRAVLAGVRGRRVAMVFQDPSTSLHPQLSIGRQLTDHVRHHLRLGRADARARAVDLLVRVAVPEPEAALGRYPHQFSGGQRQRIAIAVALACDPDVLLADEPTTALDVTVQAGVLRLLRGLVDERGLSVLLVTHDLGVMSAVADEVSVMQAGLVVESGPRERVFTDPRHPYTRSLLAALPGSVLEEDAEELVHDLVEHPEAPAGAGADSDALADTAADQEAPGA